MIFRHFYQQEYPRRVAVSSFELIFKLLTFRLRDVFLSMADEKEQSSRFVNIARGVIHRLPLFLVCLKPVFYCRFQYMDVHIF